MRKLLAAVTIPSAILCVVLICRGERVGADPAKGAPAGPPDQAQAVKPAARLPVTQVVMFNSGVGYFQRSGTIDGEAGVELLFPASGINDMLKTLVVSDPNGKVLPLRYDSQEPVEKTLKSFGIDLSMNPSYGELLNQARGEKVEISLQANPNGLPGTMTGTIMGMETRTRPGATPASPAVEKDSLTCYAPKACARSRSTRCSACAS